MNKKFPRPIGPLLIMSSISFLTVSRTEGFDNIRAVQIILILVTGVLIGLAIGMLRAARTDRTTDQPG